MSTETERAAGTPVEITGHYPRVNVECVEDFRDAFVGAAAKHDPIRMLRIHLDIPFDDDEASNWGSLVSALHTGNRKEARRIALEVAGRIIASDRRRANATIDAALAD